MIHDFCHIGLSRSTWTPGPNSMEVFGPPLNYLAPYASIQAQAQFPTLTPPLYLVARDPNTSKYLDLGEQIKGSPNFL